MTNRLSTAGSLVCTLIIAELAIWGPVLAHAKRYTLDHVAINARIDRDGSLWIEETRTYTFDGSYMGGLSPTP
jgi:hypothetical protein